MAEKKKKKSSKPEDKKDIKKDFAPDPNTAFETDYSEEDLQRLLSEGYGKTPEPKKETATGGYNSKRDLGEHQEGNPLGKVGAPLKTRTPEEAQKEKVHDKNKQGKPSLKLKEPLAQSRNTYKKYFTTLASNEDVWKEARSIFEMIPELFPDGYMTKGAKQVAKEQQEDGTYGTEEKKKTQEADYRERIVQMISNIDDEAAFDQWSNLLDEWEDKIQKLNQHFELTKQPQYSFSPAEWVAMRNWSKDNIKHTSNGNANLDSLDTDKLMEGKPKQVEWLNGFFKRYFDKHVLDNETLDSQKILNEKGEYKALKNNLGKDIFPQDEGVGEDEQFVLKGGSNSQRNSYMYSAFIPDPNTNIYELQHKLRKLFNPKKYEIIPYVPKEEPMKEQEDKEYTLQPPSDEIKQQIAQDKLRIPEQPAPDTEVTPEVIESLDKIQEPEDESKKQDEVLKELEQSGVEINPPILQPDQEKDTSTFLESIYKKPESDVEIEEDVNPEIKEIEDTPEAEKEDIDEDSLTPNLAYDLDGDDDVDEKDEEQEVTQPSPASVPPIYPISPKPIKPLIQPIQSGMKTMTPQGIVTTGTSQGTSTTPQPSQQPSQGTSTTPQPSTSPTANIQPGTTQTSQGTSTTPQPSQQPSQGATQPSTSPTANIQPGTTQTSQGTSTTPQPSQQPSQGTSTTPQPSTSPTANIQPGTTQTSQGTSQGTGAGVIQGTITPSPAAQSQTPVTGAAASTQPKTSVTTQAQQQTQTQTATQPQPNPDEEKAKPNFAPFFKRLGNRADKIFGAYRQSDWRLPNMAIPVHAVKEIPFKTKDSGSGVKIYA